MEPCREHLLRVLRTLLPMAGVPGLEFLARVEIGGDARLRVILGAGLPSGPSDLAHREHFGCAHWLVDKASKNFLVACWRLRETLLGTLRVTGGRLVRCFSNKVYEVEVAKQRAATAQQQDVNIYKHFWEPWMPRKVSRWRDMTAHSTRPERKFKAAFYVVKGGHVDGLHYAWRHVVRSLRGRPDGRVLGFDSLREAERVATALGVNLDAQM